MAKEVKVVKLSEIKPNKTLEKGLEFVHLITKEREHSDKLSFGISTLEGGFKGEGTYQDHILYQLE